MTSSFLARASVVPPVISKMTTTAASFPATLDKKSVGAFLKDFDIPGPLLKKILKGLPGKNDWFANITQDESAKLHQVFTAKYAQPASSKKGGLAIVTWKVDGGNVSLQRDGEANRSIRLFK